MRHLLFLTYCILNMSKLTFARCRSTFVRGEECLQAWKPRGISLIEDYYRLIETESALADVATTQAVLAAIPAARLAAIQPSHDPQGRLWDAVQLWKKRFGPTQEVREKRN